MPYEIPKEKIKEIFIAYGFGILKDMKINFSDVKGMEGYSNKILLDTEYFMWNNSFRERTRDLIMERLKLTVDKISAEILSCDRVLSEE